MKQLTLVLIFAVVLFPMASANGYSKDSQQFQYKYECDFLPSDVNTVPRWERSITGGVAAESLFCSVSSGILTIDTLTTPGPLEAASYSVPGIVSSLIDPSGEFYTLGDPSNPWQPDVNQGYTVEMKFKVIGVADPNATFAFWLYAQEAAAGYSNNWQIYTDKIVTHKSSGRETHHTGDLTDQMHVLRVVRKANTVPTNPSSPEGLYDLYLDGVAIATNTAGVGSAYNQNDLSFGDAAGGSGGTDIDVEIDYVRFDLTGPYTPPGVGPDPVCGDDGILIRDLDGNCRTDLGDFAMVANNWLSSTDPADASPIDCTNPANAGICEQ